MNYRSRLSWTWRVREQGLLYTTWNLFKSLAENKRTLSLLWTLRVGDSIGERINRGVVPCGTTARGDWASLGWLPGRTVVLCTLGSFLNRFRAEAKLDLISSLIFSTLFSWVLAGSGTWPRYGRVSRSAVGLTYWNVWFILPGKGSRHRGVNLLCEVWEFRDFSLEDMTVSLAMMLTLALCIILPFLWKGSCESVDTWLVVFRSGSAMKSSLDKCSSSTAKFRSRRCCCGEFW